MKSEYLLTLTQQSVFQSVHSLSDSGGEPFPDTVLARTFCG